MRTCEQDPERLRHEFQGLIGRGWLMRWLPARAHDNRLFVVLSNGVGRDEDEVRTGNAMILAPYGYVLTESRSIGNDMVLANPELDAVETSSGRRWMRGRRADLYRPLAESRGTELSPRATRFGAEN